jgi:hypothetical protein
MRDVVPLPPPRRELFADDRGGGLRVSWHAGDALVVLSVWKPRATPCGAVEDVCVGTIRLPAHDAARLSGFLSGHLDEHNRRQAETETVELPAAQEAAG